MHPDQGDANIITLQSGAKPAFIAQGVHFTIVAIASLIGLVGAIGRKRGLISFYSAFLWGSLIASAVLGYALRANQPKEPLLSHLFYT